MKHTIQDDIKEPGKLTEVFTDILTKTRKPQRIMILASPSTVSIPPRMIRPILPFPESLSTTFYLSRKFFRRNEETMNLKEITFDVCPCCGSHCGYTEKYGLGGHIIGKRYCALCGCRKPMQVIHELVRPEHPPGTQEALVDRLLKKLGDGPGCNSSCASLSVSEVRGMIRDAVTELRKEAGQ